MIDPGTQCSIVPANTSERLETVELLNSNPDGGLIMSDGSRQSCKSS
jgi:hypothetical protein